MPPTAPPLTGTRIRDQRQALGMRQSDLAMAAGISPSYLNLIEHNRRRIGGRLLNQIAAVLRVDPQALSEGGGGALVAALNAASAAEPGAGASVAQAGELAGRFPGWADLIAAQGRRIAALEARLAEVTDRLTHDTELTGSLHEVVMAVTAIHSTASILVGEADLDRDWQGRFHRNIHRDSTRLVEASQRLVRFLETPGDAGERALSPQEELEWLLDGLGHHFPDLEGPAPRRPDDVAAGFPALGQAAAGLLRVWLARYAADAAALPLAGFGPAARALAHDPQPLAQAFDQPLPRVLRRLATLPPGPEEPVLGLAVAEAGGAVTWLRSAPGMPLGRTGASCPLWPLWQALVQPGRPVVAMLALPGEIAPRLLAHAVALPRGWGPGPQVMESTMLVRRDPPPGALPETIPIGPGCRICQRDDCAARREPSVFA